LATGRGCPQGVDMGIVVVVLVVGLVASDLLSLWERAHR
jgi:hypothetical protein